MLLAPLSDSENGLLVRCVVRTLVFLVAVALPSLTVSEQMSTFFCHNPAQWAIRSVTLPYVVISWSAKLDLTLCVATLFESKALAAQMTLL